MRDKDSVFLLRGDQCDLKRPPVSTGGPFMDDDTLVSMWRDGDSAAFGELYRRYNKDLLLYVSRMDSHTPQDTAHDVWIKAWDRLSKYRNGYFPGWLFKVAYGLIIDRHRTRPKAIRCLPEYDPLPDIIDKIDFDVLTSTQRDVVILRLQGLEFKEISRRTAIPQGTCGAAYIAAVIKLRKDLVRRGVIDNVNTDLNKRYLFKKG